MAELDPRRLALVTCTLADGATPSVGTGYLIDRDLLLTASHVVPPDAGVSDVRVRIEADGSWHDADAIAAWRDAGLDAALRAEHQRRLLATCGTVPLLSFSWDSRHRVPAMRMRGVSVECDSTW